MPVVIRALWKRRPGGARGPFRAAGPDSLEERILLRALQDLAGAARGVVYDAPRGERPLRLPLTPIFLEGSRSWSRFLRARRALDDGNLTLLLSLRPLPEDERRLVVDWGATHANCFLLVEPRRPDCDLTDARSPLTQEVFDLCRRAAADEPSASAAALERWTAPTALGERLRELYGRWVWWEAPPPHGRSREESLILAGPSDTLSIQLLPLLYDRFPQQSFDVAVAELQASERELFGGAVARAHSVFRTRLGLPILHDPHAVDRAVRQLVNLGRMSVTSGGSEAVLYGPGRPVPEDMPDEEFARLEML